ACIAVAKQSLHRQPAISAQCSSRACAWNGRKQGSAVIALCTVQLPVLVQVTSTRHPRDFWSGRTGLALPLLPLVPLVPLVIVAEVEHIEQVPNGGDVGRYIG